MIAIITLLFALFLYQTIITIILFQDCYWTYFCTYILLLLLLLWHYYWHYFNIKLLLLLSFSNYIILFIGFCLYYCNYNYNHMIICIILVSDYYHNYHFQILLYTFFCSKHYLHYCNYGNRIIDINGIKWSNSNNIYLVPPVHQSGIYGYRHWV